MQKPKKLLSGSSLLLLGLLFLGLTIVLDIGLRGARLDLTQAQLYSVSDGTRNILKNIDEPINLYFYFSNQATAEVNEAGITGLRNYATRVRETLEEFTALAGGKLRLEVIDPLPFTESEDDAAGFGLIGSPFGRSGDNIFFGLAATNAIDGLETISFFEPSKEAFLEYDLARLIDALANPERPVLGLLSSIPMRGGFDPATRQMTQPWVIMEQIEQQYELRDVADSVTQIDDEIDILLLIHPRQLSQDTQLAIDQFVLRGGKLAAFVDPFAEMQPTEGDPNDPSTMFTDRSSNLAPLFAAWGVQFDPSQVTLDLAYGLEVGGPGGRPVQHAGIVGLPADAMSQDDIALAQLSSLNLAFAGSLSQRTADDGESDRGGLEFLPLLRSSEQSWQSGAQQMVMASRDPRQLLNSFDGNGESRVIAARLAGNLKTAFPDRVAAATPDDSAEANETAPAILLAESTEPVNIVIVADTDLLADRLWVQTQQIFGQRLLNAFANNGDFVVNLLDNLAGSSDLISIRGRAVSRRPFTKVEALEVDAANRFRATEEQLQTELRETERKLSELQANRDGADNARGGLLMLSPEQQTELERFQQQQVSIRKQLRKVQSDLRADIDGLGTRLKLINILLMPILLVVAALLMRGFKRRRVESNT